MKTIYTNLYKDHIYRALLLPFLILLSQTLLASTSIKPPTFSHEAGFYKSAFQLTISHDDSNAKIYFSLDGSLPDPDNLSGSTFTYKNSYRVPNNEPSKLLHEASYISYEYNEPISIHDRTREPNALTKFRTTEAEPLEVDNTLKNKAYKQINSLIRLLNRTINSIEKKLHLWRGGSDYEYVDVHRLPSLRHTFKKGYEDDFVNEVKGKLDKGTTVRAIAVVNGEASPTITKTYFVDKQHYFSTPVINIAIPTDVLYSYHSGVFVAGKQFDHWLVHDFNPRSTHSPANWRLRGQDTPAHLEIFDGSQEAIAKHIGMRIHGNGSRGFNQKNLRLYVRKKYDDSKLNYAIYGDGQPLKNSRVILRSGGDTRTSSYLSDFAAQRALGGLNFLTQRAKPYNVFINGEYHGLYIARDRHDIKTIRNRLNLPSKALTLRKDNVNHTVATNYRGVSGVSEKGVHDGHWQEFMDFVDGTAKRSNGFYSTLNEYIDVDSYIDYQAAEIFIGNKDWLRSNIAYWRYAGSEEHPTTETGYTDGRWRWLMFDIDGAGGNRHKVKNPQYKTLNRASQPFRYYSHLLNSLLKNSEFKERFIIRFADLLNTHFQAERMVSFIEEAREEIAPEMPRQIERWQTPQSYEYWNESVDELVKFYEQRPEEQFKQLEKKFSLKGRYQTTVQKEGKGTIELNTLTLEQPKAQPWAGQYFNNMPLTLNAIPAKGYAFSHWIINGEQRKQAALTLRPSQNTTVTAVFTTAGKAD